MEATALMREVTYLSKDTKELAANMLKLEPVADVSLEEHLTSDTAEIALLLEKRDELVMRCLDQYRDSMDITEEGIKESIVTNIAHERAGIDTSYHEFCISFAQMTNIARQPHDQDEDMEIGVVEANPENRFKCPITGELFENPVKNESCGHTYSKEGIMNYLKKRSFAVCPVAGCDKTVDVNSLVPDEDMAWKMV
ncbi:hypothetical protein WA171_005451 [Blastocystis sp. BT1]